jgi:hypothetical protein
MTLNSWFITEEKIATEFWDLLECFIVTLATQPPQFESSVFKNVSLIILVLMNSHSKLDIRAKMTKRTIRLRFADANANDDSKSQEASVVPEMPTLFKEKVVKMSVFICKDALKRCETSDCETSLRLFASLIECEDILRGFLAAESTSSIESMLCLIQRLLQKLRNNNTSSLFFTVLDVQDRDLRLYFLLSLCYFNIRL